MTTNVSEPEQGLVRLGVGHQTKTALAIEALRGAILRGEIGRDTPLTTTRIARQLGMSQTPVREAIRTLQAEGLLRHEPHHSASVAQYFAKDIHDIFQLRAELESQATRIAVPRLSDDDLARLDAMQAEMREAAWRGDVQRLNQLNGDWHLLIYSAADNRVLLEVVQHLWKKFMFEVNWILPGHAECSLAQHNAFLAAVHARDADEAARLIRAHIQRGEVAALSFLESREQRVSAESCGRADRRGAIAWRICSGQVAMGRGACGS
jgi:DNA-binding GntR family transcriptional regulator